MKVILTRDVPKLGKDGEIVTVAGGYARNYLFPRQLAVVAKGAAMKQHQNRLARETTRGAEQLTAAQQNAEKLRDRQFQILVKAAAGSNRLFGSVTEADVAEVIGKATGVEVDKRKISLIDPIKLTGVYELSVKLHSDVVVSFSVDVVTPEQLEARERERIAAEERAAREAARAAEAAPAASYAAPADIAEAAEEEGEPSAEEMTPEEEEEAMDLTAS
ncbi:MAG TPA: 50S ribosomal protein L9 [Chthonomonadaceae bacterium]|nr:50S ribosomal protein L9 [Chthonomonadaceae bacterium]